jgi:hypothetical protein
MASTKQITITSSLIAAAAVLVLFAAPIVTTHQVYAHRNFGTGISISTNIVQTRNCETAGSGSGLPTGSCGATSMQSISNSGGGTGISISTSTTQQTNCGTTGGSSPISGSCNVASTNTISNSGGSIGK